MRKVRIQVGAPDDVVVGIYPPSGPGNVYMIEIRADRYTRRIAVDPASLPQIGLSQGDPALMRELRTTIHAVSKLARSR